MDYRARLGISWRGIGLTASLLAMLSASPSTAQEPAKAAEEPVRKELEAFQKEIAAKAPTERLKAYEEEVELVKESDVVEKAFKVGDKAPDFELPNASGKPVKLSALLEHGPVVVTWYRGAWCPYCNISLQALQAALPEFEGVLL